MTTISSTAKKSSKGTFFIILLFLLAAAGVAAFFLFFEGQAPTVAIHKPEGAISSESTIVFAAQDKESGLQQVRLTISQGDKSQELFAADYARKGFTGLIGTPEEQNQVVFKPKEAGFSEGPAQLTLQARDYSAHGFFKGNKSSITQEVVIDLSPPKIAILHSEQYISPGGSGIVIYRLDDNSARSGLLVNGHYHPGFVVGDGRDDVYIAYFGVPYDAAGLNESLVLAEDAAGNQTRMGFSSVFKKVAFKQDNITISDGFLQAKIPEFEQHYPQMQGSMIEKYLFTNNEIRLENNDRISKLCNSPQPERLWQKSFLRMSGSSRAGYADHRTYFYNSKSIDQQVHLGMDIASTERAEVKASEKGIVTFADYLGIYGNMVLLDHGQGIFSLYSHLSQIQVAPGDTLEQGAVLGTTGTSGMAGGDHLHFSMLVNGIFVTPKEWWDQHWIDVTIEEPLASSRF